MLQCKASTRMTLPVWQLQYVPVDTIICFRASCPIVIAVIEFLYLGRELPSLRSWASLLGEDALHPEAPAHLTVSSEPSNMPSLTIRRVVPAPASTHHMLWHFTLQVCLLESLPTHGTTSTSLSSDMSGSSSGTPLRCLRWCT